MVKSKPKFEPLPPGVEVIPIAGSRSEAECLPPAVSGVSFEKML
jgi:hypothetical protein